MKPSISFILAALAVVFSVLACTLTDSGNLGGETVRGSGKVVEETRTYSNIDEVQLAMEGTLHISTGGSPMLRIQAEDNLMEYIRTENRAGKLTIDTQEGINLLATKAIDYYLTIDRLNAIAVSSSGDVEAGNIQSDSFSVKISSSGNISIDKLDCSSLRVDISSSGNLDILEGRVKSQNINISSSGEYHAENLESDEADATLTSGGDATIRVSDHLSGRLSSSGNLYYIGQPVMDVRTTSSGRTVQVEDTSG